MRLLSAPRREAAFAVYAFCRAVDDIADGDGPFEDRRAALAVWREKTAAIYRGEDADSPQARAVRRFNLPQDAFDAIIDGMETDLSGPVVAPDLAALELYCARVAGAVGRLLVRIFADDRRADDDRFALVLGEALQLTNILRDVAEDAARGRIYLPRDLLRRHGLRDEDILQQRYDDRFVAMASDFADAAEREYRRAWEALRQADGRALLPAEIMGRTYHRILGEIRARNFNVFTRRPALRRRDKLEVAARAIARSALSW